MPAETLHIDAERTQQKQRDEIAPIAGRLEGREKDDSEHERRHKHIADQRNLRQLAGQHHAKAGADDVGDSDRPDHDIDQIELIRDQFDPGLYADQHKTAEQNGHAAGAGDTEQDGRDQRAAFLGVVRGFRRNHAAHVTGAVAFFIVRGLNGVAVSDPIDHRPAEAGQRTHQAADDRTAER